MIVFKAEGQKEEDIDKLFREARRLYQSKKYMKCEELLQKVEFPSFSTKEWIKENNVLLCKLQNVGQASIQEVETYQQRFESLIQKLKGLPSEAYNPLWQVIISFNYSYLLVTKHVSCTVADRHKACAVLSNAILRVAPPPQSLAQVTEEVTFEEGTCNAVQNAVKQILTNSNSVTVPLLLSFWLVTLLWLSQHKERPATCLLQSLQDQLQKAKEASLKECCDDNVILFIEPAVSSDVFPLSLLPASSELNLENVMLLVTSTLALCYFSIDKNDEAEELLSSLQLSTTTGKLAFYILYLRGLILYRKDLVNEALSCFTQCPAHKDHARANHISAVFTMIGRCLSKQGKPHTAIAKYKEALSYCATPTTDTCYYAAVEFGNLAKRDTQIQLLKTAIKGLLLKKISIANDGPSSFALAPFKCFMQNLDGCEVSLPNVFYTMAKLCMEEKRFAESAEAYSDLLSELTNNPKLQVADSVSHLPSVSRLYRDLVIALLLAGRYRDCVTTCDHILSSTKWAKTTAQNMDPKAIESPSSGKKRQRMPSEETADPLSSGDEDYVLDLELMLCQARSLSHMEEFLAALETLKRFFDRTAEYRRSPVHCEGDGATEKRRRQESKRIKLDSGSSAEAEKMTGSKSENTEDRRKLIMSQAHLARGLVLQSLDQDKEALEEIHQSLLWHPGYLPASYHYSTLLFKFGRSKEGAHHWITTRGLRDSHQGTIKSNIDSYSTGIPSSEWVTQEQIAMIDSQALQHYKHS